MSRSVKSGGRHGQASSTPQAWPTSVGHPSCVSFWDGLVTVAPSSLVTPHLQHLYLTDNIMTGMLSLCILCLPGQQNGESSHGSPTHAGVADASPLTGSKPAKSLKHRATTDGMPQPLEASAAGHSLGSSEAGEAPALHSHPMERMLTA